MANKKTISNMLLFLFNKIRKQKVLLSVSFLSLLGISFFEFKIPQMTQQIIDDSLSKESVGLIIIKTIYLLIYALILSLLGYLSTILMSRLSQSVIIEMREELYHQILNQDYVYFETAKTGDLMTRLSSDVKTLQDLISPQSLKLLSNMFTFIFIYSFMLYQDVKLTSLMTVTFPLLFFLNVFFSRKIKRAYRKVRQSTSMINNHLQTSLTSILLIKSFASESIERKQFRQLNIDNKKDYLEAMTYQTIFSPAVDFINYLGMAIVLVYSGNQVIQGEQTVGHLVAYLAYLKMLQNPIRSFTQMISRFQQAVVSYERIMEVYESTPKIKNTQEPLILKGLSTKVTFDRVTFEYQNEQPILKDVSFDIPVGQVTALVGVSGSGKTTITKLISRLYDVTTGTILVNEQRIQDYSIKSLRKNIGIVTQEIELVDGSIYDNLVYGLLDRERADVMLAVESANLMSFVNSLPDGLETEIGEKGIKLSGGQKQRIAIARVFLKNAPFLILDEATASLDNESERYIQKSLDDLLDDRTSLVIAHRLSTIQKANQILVLDQGRIVERGTHEELLNHEGRYKELYEAQFS